MRKQLLADHADVLEARREKRPRPQFPRLWILAAGRPDSVIRGYALTPSPSFPPAFLQGLEQGVKKGLEQGVKKMLPRLYQARFGAPPPAILAAIDAMHDADTLDQWADLFTAKSAEEIAAALAPATTREG